MDDQLRSTSSKKVSGSLKHRPSAGNEVSPRGDPPPGPGDHARTELVVIRPKGRRPVAGGGLASRWHYAAIYRNYLGSPDRCRTLPKIQVTSALPYTNGPIRHLVEYIQTDIWVRFQRLTGNDCLYICASDAHGTPIMLKAQELGVAPEALAERFRTEHQRDFGRFHIAFDNYYTTHSPENRELVERIYASLCEKDLVEWRSVRQAYDEQAGMFLPDRFIRGTCPVCGTKDQYGDSCENCGATYSPTDLIDARSAVSGSKPVERESQHLFFRLSRFEPSLRRWTTSGGLDDSVARKLGEWFDAGLKDWDISRDAPYFGFAIPGAEGKFFYVWLDAPVGYMASLLNLANESRKNQQVIDFDSYWNADSRIELYHFIGKDIAYFHTLFWPAVLEGAGFRKPTAVFVHGFLTANGKKMSKSRGTFISAAAYLDHLAPEYLRYYYACKLGPGTDDIDLNFDDFIARVNSDLVGKFINIASRCAGLYHPPVPRPPGRQTGKPGAAPGIRSGRCRHRRMLRAARIRPRAARGDAPRRSRQSIY